MKTRRAILLAAVAIFPIAVVGCGDGGPKQPPLTPESWISKPAGDWPQIVLTNDAAFNVMTVWFDARKNGDKYLEAGGEDAATIYADVQSGR